MYITHHNLLWRVACKQKSLDTPALKQNDDMIVFCLLTGWIVVVGESCGAFCLGVRGLMPLRKESQVVTVSLYRETLRVRTNTEHD